MDFVDTAFYFVSTALALYFAHVRFRARMPLFGHAMLGTALFHLIFALEGMDLPANIAAASFVLLYMKSLAILQEHGLHDGSLS